MTLQEIKFIQLAIADKFHLDLNYDGFDAINVKIENLVLYPYDGENTDRYVLQAHTIFLKLCKLIEELSREADRSSCTSIPVVLRDFNPSLRGR